MTAYAHTHPDYPKDPSHWQPLEAHLRNVAELAAEFARPFGGEEWARVAGLWHDLGKYSDAFQKKLFDANGMESHLETIPGKVVHSEAGGHLAQLNGWRGIDRALCWLIMGHHTGLTDYEPHDSGARALSLKMRHPEKAEPLLDRIPDSIRQQPQPSAPKPLLDGADVAFFIRMLFSCLVDADFLDTERFMNREKSGLRTAPYPEMNVLLKAFNKHMDGLCSSAPDTEVNRVRASVLAQCRSAAESQPNVFSLTVPTGGGKTLASMAFALRHAVKHGKRRIIYVIPYTSIIEQTASVFRSIPGFEQAVLEHHANVADSGESRESVRSRLAAENWDAPVIVTTSVQFFESLYACRTSRCRKLHNMANSVTVFDEAQCLPPECLRPIVFAIRELRRHYGTTAVLCTATQPVLEKTDSFDFKFREGFDRVVPIIDYPDRLAEQLKRVEVKTLADLAPLTPFEISSRIAAITRPVLCIVNSKRGARAIAEALSAETTLHLSTNMCAEHRLIVIAEIRRRLERHPNAKLHVISTSLVEAGVDLDFPIVFRALAGLDSIAQAAGRCNREGRLPTAGETFVFAPERQPAYVRQPVSLGREFLRADRMGDIFKPETFCRYFRLRFFQLGSSALDSHGIRPLLSGNMDFAFRTAANRFRMIDDDWQRSLIVPFGEAQALLDRMATREWEARMLLRALQRYAVSVPLKTHERLLSEGYAREWKTMPGLYVLDDKALYSDKYGFTHPDEINGYEPETVIA